MRNSDGCLLKSNRITKTNWRLYQERNGIDVDPRSLFDVQAKRLHEYKRQVLNALHIIYLYSYILENPDAPVTPRTFYLYSKSSTRIR